MSVCDGGGYLEWNRNLLDSESLGRHTELCGVIRRLASAHCKDGVPDVMEAIAKMNLNTSFLVGPVLRYWASDPIVVVVPPLIDTVAAGAITENGV